MEKSARLDLDDPRVVALAKARRQIAHERNGNATYGELTSREKEDVLWDALHFLNAAMRAGLIPSDTPPSDEHDRVYVDDEGFLYTDYRTVPAGDEVVRVVWDEGSATSRRELEIEHGATFTHIGWCK